VDITVTCLLADLAAATRLGKECYSGNTQRLRPLPGNCSEVVARLNRIHSDALRPVAIRPPYTSICPSVFCPPDQPGQGQHNKVPLALQWDGMHIVPTLLKGFCNHVMWVSSLGNRMFQTKASSHLRDVHMGHATLMQYVRLNASRHAGTDITGCAAVSPLVLHAFFAVSLQRKGQLAKHLWTRRTRISRKNTMCSTSYPTRISRMTGAIPLAQIYISRISKPRTDLGQYHPSLKNHG